MAINGNLSLVEDGITSGDFTIEFFFGINGTWPTSTVGPMFSLSQPDVDIYLNGDELVVNHFYTAVDPFRGPIPTFTSLVSNAVNFVADQIYHIVVTISDASGTSEAKLIIDKVEHDVNSLAYDPAYPLLYPNNATLQLGYLPDLEVTNPSVEFAGLAFYKYVIDDAQILQNYNDAFNLIGTVPAKAGSLTITTFRAEIPNFAGIAHLSIATYPARITLAEYTPTAITIDWSGVVATIIGSIVIEWTILEVINESYDIEWTGYTIDESYGIQWYEDNVINESYDIEWYAYNEANYPQPYETWSLSVVLDGVDVSSKLTGMANIDYEEDASALAMFSIVPDIGSINAMSWIGKKVTIDVTGTVNGSTVYSVRRYTGLINDAIYNPETAIITFKCTNDIQGFFESMEKSDIRDALNGYWSKYVFKDEDVNGWEHAQDVMSTKQSSVWLDARRTLRVTDWAAKTTADFEFTDQKRFHNTLKLQRSTRRSMINKIRLGVDYKYTKLRQRDIRYVVSAKENGGYCDYLVKNYPPLTIDKVQNAIDKTGWQQIGEVYTAPFYKPGYYSCDGVLIGLVSAPDNVITEARFKLSKRWTQTVVERYSITITAPNSIEYIGTMSEEKNIAIASDYENKDWSINPYSSVSADATQDDVGDFVIDTSDDTESSGNRDDADAAQEAIISYCRSQIIGSHRNNTVSFQVPFHPLVNLSHTVKCTSSELTAKGKVRQVVDEFNIDTGDASTTINLAISAHGGTGIVADYPPEAVEPPSADGTVDEYDNDRLLQTYVGGLASSLPYNEEWEGYIVNSDNTYVTWFDGYPTAAAGYEYYPIEGVVIKTSEISGNAIESLDVQQTASLTVDIPQDTLTLNA